MGINLWYVNAFWYADVLALPHLIAMEIIWLSHGLLTLNGLHYQNYKKERHISVITVHGTIQSSY